MKILAYCIFFIIIAIVSAITMYYGRIYFPKNFRTTESLFIENFIVLYLIILVIFLLIMLFLNEIFEIGIE